MVQRISRHPQKAPEVRGLPQSPGGLHKEEPGFEGKRNLPAHTPRKSAAERFEAVELSSWGFLPRFQLFLLKIKSVILFYFFFLWPWNRMTGLLARQKGFVTHSETHFSSQKTCSCLDPITPPHGGSGRRRLVWLQKALRRLSEVQVFLLQTYLELSALFTQVLLHTKDLFTPK